MARSPFSEQLVLVTSARLETFGFQLFFPAAEMQVDEFRFCCRERLGCFKRRPKRKVPSPFAVLVVHRIIVERSSIELRPGPVALCPSRVRVPAPEESPYSPLAVITAE